MCACVILRGSDVADSQSSCHRIELGDTSIICRDLTQPEFSNMREHLQSKLQKSGSKTADCQHNGSILAQWKLKIFVGETLLN